MIRSPGDNRAFGILADLMDGDRPERMPALLACAKNVTMVEEHRWQLTIAGGASAILERDTDNVIRVTFSDSAELLDADRLLLCQADWPGNLRVASRAQETFLTAELPVDNASQCGQGLAELRRTIRGATGCRTVRGARQPIVSAESVREQLKELPAEQLVEIDRARSWELRLTVRKELVAVRLVIDAGGLRLRRAVVAEEVREEAWPSVRLRARQINAELRGARLTPVAKSLMAESRLPAGDCRGGNLLHAARAVAVASLHARPSLELLASEPDVATEYLRMFSTA